MSDAIKEISKACQSLEGKDSSPPSAGTLPSLSHYKKMYPYLHSRKIFAVSINYVVFVAAKILRGLHFEMTKVYIIRLCSWMRTTTREISSGEVWVTLTTLERNKSSYAISYMPLEFRELIISSMDRIDL